ncbi:DUF3784 domain-containing protein [Dyadobacter subterraneus]|uniref:DUF3784 domain-containing protein n=1 Tax=Dyadobacter subterraneus TaxID=2773304 RepID=A0ABR9WLL7_9BACT|nr:DUF3784 domain-containing protein [Dyadobacter subterraneus]MBE9466248.1 DUF3784 domain-containing protein [Dyadobacter subterraneus]
MIIPAILLSVVFVSMGFLVTKNNARYILSGYNMMSEQQRSLVDMDGYLRFFKQFHLHLGISVFALVMIVGTFNANFAAIILGTYPLLAYCYFVLKGNRYFPDIKNRRIWTKVTVGILFLTTCGVGYLFFNGFKNNEILLEENNLKITGMYGEKISRDKILDVKIVDELPKITMKSNGFAAGDFRKGYFKTKDRKTIKLFVNKREKQILLLNTMEGDVYFSSSDVDSEDLFLRIEKWRRL